MYWPSIMVEALADGSPREVQENPDVIKAYLGEDQDA